MEGRGGLSGPCWVVRRFNDQRCFLFSEANNLQRNLPDSWHLIEPLLVTHIHKYRSPIPSLFSIWQSKCGVNRGGRTLLHPVNVRQREGEGWGRFALIADGEMWKFAPWLKFFFFSCFLALSILLIPLAVHVFWIYKKAQHFQGILARLQIWLCNITVWGWHLIICFTR